MSIFKTFLSIYFINCFLYCSLQPADVNFLRKLTIGQLQKKLGYEQSKKNQEIVRAIEQIIQEKKIASMPPSKLALALANIENEDIIHNIIQEILITKDRASLEKIYKELKESPNTQNIAQELAEKNQQLQELKTKNIALEKKAQETQREKKDTAAQEPQEKEVLSKELTQELETINKQLQESRDKSLQQEALLKLKDELLQMKENIHQKDLTKLKKELAILKSQHSTTKEEQEKKDAAKKEIPEPTKSPTTATAGNVPEAPPLPGGIPGAPPAPPVPGGIPGAPPAPPVPGAPPAPAIPGAPPAPGKPGVPSAPAIQTAAQKASKLKLRAGRANNVLAILSDEEKNQLKLTDTIASDLAILTMLDDMILVDALNKKSPDDFIKEVVTVIQKLTQDARVKKRKELALILGKRFATAAEMDTWFLEYLKSLVHKMAAEENPEKRAALNNFIEEILTKNKKPTIFATTTTQLTSELANEQDGAQRKNIANKIEHHFDMQHNIDAWLARDIKKIATNMINKNFEERKELAALIGKHFTKEQEVTDWLKNVEAQQSFVDQLTAEKNPEVRTNLFAKLAGYSPEPQDIDNWLTSVEEANRDDTIKIKDQQIDQALQKQSFAHFIKENWKNIEQVNQEFPTLIQKLKEQLLPLVFDPTTIDVEATDHLDLFAITAAQPFKNPIEDTKVNKFRSNTLLYTLFQQFINTDMSLLELLKEINKLRIDHRFIPHYIITQKGVDTLQKFDKFLGAELKKTKSNALLLNDLIVGGGSTMIKPAILFNKMAKSLPEGDDFPIKPISSALLEDKVADTQTKINNIKGVLSYLGELTPAEQLELKTLESEIEKLQAQLIVSKDLDDKLKAKIAKYDDYIGLKRNARRAKRNISLELLNALQSITNFNNLSETLSKLAKESWIKGVAHDAINKAALIVLKNDIEKIDIEDFLKTLEPAIDINEDNNLWISTQEQIKKIFNETKESMKDFNDIKTIITNAIEKSKHDKIPTFGELYNNIKHISSKPIKKLMIDLEKINREIPDGFTMGNLVIHPSQAKASGESIDKLFRKQYPEQIVWNMLEPYGLLIKIFTTMIPLSPQYHNIIGVLQRATLQNPIGAIDDLEPLIATHVKHRMHKDNPMSEYQNTAKKIAQDLEQYNITEALNALKSLIIEGKIITENNPTLQDTLQLIDQFLINAIILKFKKTLTDALNGDSITFETLSIKGNEELFTALTKKQNKEEKDSLKDLIELLPIDEKTLKNYTFKEDEWDKIVTTILKRLPQKDDALTELQKQFDIIKSAIPKLQEAHRSFGKS